MTLIKLELARSEIKRYLESLNKASDSNSEFRRLSRAASVYAPASTTDASILDLSGALLEDNEFFTILPEIAKLNLVTELNLEGNQITGKSIEKLRQFLPNLERLNLSHNWLWLGGAANEGFRELAQFARLSYLNIESSGIKSENIDILIDSNSLLKVSYAENSKIDIVRKARLEAACDYNNRVRIQKGVCTAPMTETKDDYIRNNVTNFAKTVAEREKQSAWLRQLLNTPTHTPEIFKALKIK